MSTTLPPALTAPPTEARGELSPALAAKLDELSDQGRTDRLLSQLGVNPEDTRGSRPEVDGQLSLFDVSEDGTTLVSYEGETL